MALTLYAIPVSQAQSEPDPVASDFRFFKFPGPQPVCDGVGFNTQPSFAYQRSECGFGDFALTGAPAGATVQVRLSQDGTTIKTVPATVDAGSGSFNITPEPGWPAGLIDVDVLVDDVNAGEARFLLNYLGATLAVDDQPGGYAPGDEVGVSGEIHKLNSIGAGAEDKTGVPATFSLRLVTPDGDVRGPYGPFTAADNGTFTQTLPAEATAGITATAEDDFLAVASVQVIDAAYADPSPLGSGNWASDRPASAPVTLSVPPDSLILENSFVSAVGWVKPGETYPFRLLIKNFGSEDETGAVVTVPAPDGTTFTQVAPSSEGSIGSDGSITWNAGTIPAATDAGPGVKTLVVEGDADTLAADPELVWKDLSSTATLTYDGGPTGLTSTSHGPKVIPQDKRFNTARYGDRPFPVVPVDFFDRKHEAEHSGERLASVINSPDVEGSTFNLFQEMSFGQLFPEGTVPSAGIATAPMGPGFDSEGFTDPQPQGTCHGTTYKQLAGSSLYDERIADGWYQMPGDTDYYGDDRFGSALIGAVGGVGAAFQIDDACGPTGKAVYDAAHISDPEIDYSDYDTDKDGVVDFFMMVFVGQGGHGASQTSVPPYDNIWPHSSSLEFYYTDPDTGLKGYVSDDQLKNLEGDKMYYTDNTRSQMTTNDTGIPVYVRVGPYNVNPETAIDAASVISHEYGHSLGLPDFYSTGSRETYGDWNLMATDKSQNMDVFSKQEMGWIVPRVLDAGDDVDASGWKDSKFNTHRIDWVTPEGDPYTLSGPGVNNGEAYVAKLPPRRIIDPQKVEQGASPDHVWWSESGNDFGCTPEAGHNLDIFLPQLEDVPEGTEVKVTYKSYWDIEWDYDYGFTMYTTDGGESYESMPSEKGYTTAGFNPNANSCQQQYDDGLTGTSGSYERGTEDVDRVLGNYPDGPFLEDSYDLSEAAGSKTTLRFSYATDPGLARPGWFIDNLKVTAGGETIYDSTFETSDDEQIYNGGCRESLTTAGRCTEGWSYVNASTGSPADHAYYLEMRDRSGFDLDGHGQNDREPIGFAGGLLLTYTDEAHGYGNAGTDDPPAQSPLDSQPQPGNSTPNLNDAAFTTAPGDSHFSDGGSGHTDNYDDPSSEDGNWHFRYDCLTFDVGQMGGNENGPDTAPGDLQGDVTFDMGQGCGKFDYGFEGSGDDTPDGEEPPREDCSVTGTPEDDVLRGTSKDEVICGLGGNDTLLGNGGNDTLLGGAGRDTIRGGAGKDAALGGEGKDTTFGEKGEDTMKGGPDPDTVNGGAGRDALKGNAGPDTLRGGGTGDILQGGDNGDVLYGEGGDDSLKGGDGPDILNGGPDNDVCQGGNGTDRQRSC
jgi:M6 family metalloprotease-like protein